VSPYSVVGIAIGLRSGGMRNCGLIAVRSLVSFKKVSKSAVGHNDATVLLVGEALYPGIKQPQRETEPPPTSSACVL
jgi:hypothetical protein